MKVGLLTIIQKDTLIGEMVSPDWYFYPIQMTDGEWVISTQEMEASEFPELDWVKTLPLVDWLGPYQPITGDTPNYFTQFFSGETN